MKNLFISILLVVSAFCQQTFAQDNPCLNKPLTICEKNPEGNPICQILKQDGTETVDSISQFLHAVFESSLNDEERELVICARLVGRKRIEFLGDTSFRSGVISADATGPGIRFRLPKNTLISEWDELEMKAKRLLPDYIVCPQGPKFKLIVQGDVTKIEEGDFLPVNLVIWITNVTILDPQPIKARMRFLQEKINQSMKNLLASGLGKQADMVLVDDVGFVPPITSMNQVEFVPLNQVKFVPPSKMEDYNDFDPGKVLGQIYCGEPLVKLGQRHAEWMEQHQSEIPAEFQKHLLFFPGTNWKNSGGARFLVPCLRWIYSDVDDNLVPQDGKWQIHSCSTDDLYDYRDKKIYFLLFRKK